MRRWLLGLFCVVLSGAALAAGPRTVRKRAQASMLVTGWIEVAPTGAVAHYDLDQASKLPPMVVKLIGQTLPGWMFEPALIDGKSVRAKARMSLRVVADPVGNGSYGIRVAGAQFEAPARASEAATDELREKRVVAPLYPAAPVSGTVYVLLMVDRSGHVEHALAQQVDLGVVASDAQMTAYRRLLAEAATKAARQWTFSPPTTGSLAADPYWLARAPISFEFYGQVPPAYGHWDVYIPGPIKTAPWLAKELPSIANDKLIIANVDSTPAGGNFSLTSGLHLLSKLGGG